MVCRSLWTRASAGSRTEHVHVAPPGVGLAKQQAEVGVAAPARHDVLAPHQHLGVAVEQGGEDVLRDELQGVREEDAWNKGTRHHSSPRGLTQLS